MGLEEFLRTVEQEPEGQEDLDIRSLLQNPLVHGLGVLELVDAYGVCSWLVTDGVQRVEDLETSPDLGDI